VGVLALGAIPAFVAETKFAGEAFTLFRWKSPQTRKQVYLEVLMAREDHAKEVKLLQLGPMLIRRYAGIFDDLYARDRSLALRRGLWGFLLGLFSTAALYGAYAWIAVSAIWGVITLGGMTMYLLLFKQGASAFSAILSSIGGMYEDNLYLSNLYEYLEEPESEQRGSATEGPNPDDGIRFEDVTFRYPGSDRIAVEGVSLHLQPGQKLALVGPNGSGKTTLIKLLTRLYVPDSGRILLDGLDLQEWDAAALHLRIGVIFQDFVRYQFTLGENIGVGDVSHLEDRERWQQAADQALAADFVDELPLEFDTQLGRWFEDGRELSLGQWQKVALARAFMREKADILVLDEPTAAIDAEAEARLFERFRDMTTEKMAILISHRFSTVRVADTIVVLEGGRVVETGSHAALMEKQGLYERLFTLQAQGYR
jgi:ATP-binding cassette subfamily B protein